MKRSLTSEGIINQTLFHVHGELVETYNSALESLTGKRTGLDSFYIDKRGESPEVEAELGNNTLQCSTSHRFCIILSPDQQSAELIHEEFSFDETVLDHLYENFMPSISVATRLDGLYGELNDGIRAFYGVEDLLLLKSVNVSLKSTSGFLEKAIETQHLISELKNNPEKLVENDSKTVRDLFNLAQTVGDIRGFSQLIPVSAEHSVSHFYTRLFNGAYVFRKNKGRTFTSASSAKPKRQPVGMTKETITVIYNDADSNETPKSDSAVLFIPMSDIKAVLTFLLKNQLVIQSDTLIDQKLTTIEDIVLVEKGIDVTGISLEKRTQELSALISDMPPLWNELIDIKRHYARGKSLLTLDCSSEAKGMLLLPSAPDSTLTKMVCHLLTRLFPYNYQWMLQYNNHDLEKLFEQGDELMKNYLVSTLSKMA